MFWPSPKISTYLKWVWLEQFGLLDLEKLIVQVTNFIPFSCDFKLYFINFIDFYDISGNDIFCNIVTASVIFTIYADHDNIRVKFHKKAGR